MFHGKTFVCYCPVVLFVNSTVAPSTGYLGRSGAKFGQSRIFSATEMDLTFAGIWSREPEARSVEG